MPQLARGMEISMKDGEKRYSTSQIAGIVGLHPNTVRKYEEWGLLQTPERKPNGYRVYTDVHIKQFELAKKALQSVIVQAGRCTMFINYKTRTELWDDLPSELGYNS